MSAAEVKELVRRACEEWLAAHPNQTLVDFAAEAGVPYTGGLMRWRGRGGIPSAAYLISILQTAGMFSENGFSKALTLAAEMVRRLEAGERLPPERLRQVAAETDRAGEAAHQFADRLRREAAALG